MATQAAKDKPATVPSVVDNSEWKSAEELVDVDIGGQIFRTTLETLTKNEGSYLATCFSGPFDRNKTLFVDRDPGLFKAILQFLRTGEIFVAENREAALRDEAQFYGLEKEMFGERPVVVQEEPSYGISRTRVLDIAKTFTMYCSPASMLQSNTIVSGVLTWICDGHCNSTIRVQRMPARTMGNEGVDICVVDPQYLTCGDTAQFTLFETDCDIRIENLEPSIRADCSGSHTLSVTTTIEVAHADIKPLATKKRKKLRDSDSREMVGEPIPPEEVFKDVQPASDVFGILRSGRQ